MDTTCGSVLHVWKRVESYARDGFTALIHGKYTHEESRATASQVNKHEGGKYIIVRDMDEASLVCDYIAQRPGRLGREAFMEHFGKKATPGFDPDVDLAKVGVANQTTMLAKRVARHRDEGARGHGRALRRGARGSRTSAPSARSARRPRNGRTPLRR